jgi:hypothetical protein
VNDEPPPIDTRYDPVYQRGFAGKAVPRIRAVAPPDTESTDRPRAPRFQARQQTPDVQDSTTPTVPVWRDDLDDVAHDGAAPAPEVTTDADGARAGRLTAAGNPWLLSMWVVAVLLLSVGFYGTWRSQGIYAGAEGINDSTGIIVYRVLELLAPLAALAGLLAICALIAIYAVAWRPKQVDADDAANSGEAG